MYDKYFNASLILASKFGMKLDMQSHRRISSPAIGGCCKTAEVPAVTALYERRFFDPAESAGLGDGLRVSVRR